MWVKRLVQNQTMTGVGHEKNFEKKTFYFFLWMCSGVSQPRSNYNWVVGHEKFLKKKLKKNFLTFYFFWMCSGVSQPRSNYNWVVGHENFLKKKLKKTF